MINWAVSSGPASRIGRIGLAKLWREFLLSSRFSPLSRVFLAVDQTIMDKIGILCFSSYLQAPHSREGVFQRNKSLVLLNAFPSILLPREGDQDKRPNVSSVVEARFQLWKLLPRLRKGTVNNHLTWPVPFGVSSSLLKIIVLVLAIWPNMLEVLSHYPFQDTRTHSISWAEHPSVLLVIVRET